MVKAPEMEISNQELLERLWMVFGKFPEPELTRETTALVMVDLQHVCAHPDFGFGAKAKSLGIGDFFDYYYGRIKDVVIPNLQRLQRAARERGIEVIHVRVASSTDDGRETTKRYKTLGLRNPRNTIEGEILPEVGPVGDELVINKFTSSAFNSTNIDRLLRNLGIRNLIVTGVVTNGCVESTVRSAYELDYGTIVVEDCTAAFAPQLHESGIHNMSHMGPTVKSADEVIKLLDSL